MVQSTPEAMMIHSTPFIVHVATLLLSTLSCCSAENVYCVKPTDTSCSLCPHNSIPHQWRWQPQGALCNLTSPTQHAKHKCQILEAFKFRSNFSGSVVDQECTLPGFCWASNCSPAHTYSIPGTGILAILSFWTGESSVHSERSCRLRQCNAADLISKTWGNLRLMVEYSWLYMCECMCIYIVS